MSFSKSRLFEPSYIWKNQKEITEKKGILSRILGLKSDEKSGKNKSHGKYQELNESSEDTEKKTFGSVLKIISSKNGKFSVNWQNENEKIKLLEISEHEMSTVFFETLQKSNFCIGELFLCLEKGKSNSGFLMTHELPQISVGKLYMRMETFEMVEWWMRRISSIDLTDLSISPFGDHPINLTDELFEMPHVTPCCHYSKIPHFSFYSDNISESVVKAAVESKMSSVNGDYVLEWFFARRVNTEDVLQEVVRPSCERKERFSHQKQCFEPVDVYPVSNENNKKLSLMIVKDPSDHFNPYSLVLFS
ncbi:hypothetical protein CAEBREN_07497 [Caenorhabditis brenneri]|uniref:Uncharacterized protein n=1 Tax=Caenorhabditis brenneri TaxID=135651 RepID=G0N5D0_CAEBE|nr:hypothetical protein CAEBREN_07497 [Caenorhabditis brenneri]